MCQKNILISKKRYPNLSWILFLSLLILLILLLLLLVLFKPHWFVNPVVSNFPNSSESSLLVPESQEVTDIENIKNIASFNSSSAVLSEKHESIPVSSLNSEYSDDIINKKAYSLFNKFFNLRTILLQKDYNKVDSELYIQSQEFLTKIDKLLLPFSSFKFDMKTLDSLENEVYPKFKNILDNLNIAYDKILMKRFDKQQSNYASKEEISRFLNSGSSVSTTSNVLNKCTSLLSDLANIFKPNSDILAISQLLSANVKI